MIPLKLQIKNFLSYGSEIQTIDFGQYPLICLSGKNGHGKSALLDAITWTIWGHARKLMGNTKADQGLLRLGQTQMMTCFDFECNGQHYRIKREFMQTYGKPVAILDFGMLDTTQDKYIPLTEKTIRDTQANIDQTLHLTFDAFINSAFLRQGQANEFSKKSPKERKEVLASILGLDRYESIRKLASDRIKQTNTYTTHLTTLNNKLIEQLAQEPLIHEKLIQLNYKHQNILEQEKNLIVQHKQLEHDTALLAEQKQQFTLLTYQHQQLLHEQETQHTNLKKLINIWRTINKQHRTCHDYAALEARKKEAVDNIKTHQNMLQEQLILKQELLTHKESTATYAQTFHEKKSVEINTKKIAIERLATQKNHLESTITNIQIACQRNETEIIKCQQELDTLQQSKDISLEKKRIIEEKQFEKRKEHYQAWIAQANIISNQLTVIEQKNKLVYHEESPSCPLCEQNLSASRKRFLKHKFEEEAQFLKQRYARLSGLIKKIKMILIEQHAILENLKKQEQTAREQAIKIDEVSKTMSKYQLEQTDMNANLAKQQELLHIVTTTIGLEQQSLEQHIIHSKKELEEAPEYQQLQVAIKKIDHVLATHIYNKSAHDQAMHTLNLIEKQLEQYKQIQEHYVLQTQRFDQIDKICAQIKKIKQQLAQLTISLHNHKTIEAQEQNLSHKKQELVTFTQQLAQTKELLLQEKGSLENQQKTLTHLKEEHEKHHKELITCATLIDDYQAIAHATGKDGIQALLIEDTIPEIEHETNELLGKLTDNQTQLFIESLRDLKKGGTKETLDIKISDAAGIRPYELFSGGEAFRIDFALRIAISKLLARRAGTSLQTLIIDEGFGSQDEEGLNHIMDAIYKIQADFAKIIIVSHLNSMKNQFPVHFVIEKGPQGSIVQVMEQG
jgi:DNA repair protein SbcC/Rad50